MALMASYVGRTDDLIKNPNAGRKEVRHTRSLGEAKALYEKIFNEKTSSSKGYHKVCMHLLAGFLSVCVLRQVRCGVGHLDFKQDWLRQGSPTQRSEEPGAQRSVSARGPVPFANRE